VARLNATVNDLLKEADVQERMQQLGLDPRIESTADTAAFFKSEVANWGRMVSALGLSMN